MKLGATEATARC